MAAKARLLELVAANAPVLYLHPADRYMPCSVDWFRESHIPKTPHVRTRNEQAAW